MKLTVRAPATVANLGPGFDSLGLALGLWNEFILETDVEAGLAVVGEGAEELGSAATNLVVRMIEERFAALGRAVPPFALSCTNRVPLRRGLGSSTTAAVAGSMLGAALAAEPVSPEMALADAARVDGHADNAAACLYGSLTIAYALAEVWRAVRVDLHASLRPVVLIPSGEEVATTAGRAVLPTDVSLADAVFNLSHAALAVHAFTRRPDLLPEALADRLHQVHRLALAPRASWMFERLAGQGFPVCVAGSGPSLLAFEDDHHRVDEPTDGWTTLRPGLALEGASLVREG
jgi:homoserine kinase